MSKRTFVIVTILVIMGLFVLLFLIIKPRQPSGLLVLTVKPADSTIKIDGKKHRQGKIRLLIGNHLLIISRSGFADTTFKFSIKTGQTLTENFGLKPNSGEGYDWVQKHPGDILQGEVVSPDRQNQINQTLSKYPLISYLPYHSTLYNIDYTSDDNGNITFKISAATAVGRQVAIARIYSWGFDPTDYNLVFSGFINPFSASQNSGAN